MRRLRRDLGVEVEGQVATPRLPGSNVWYGLRAVPSSRAAVNGGQQVHPDRHRALTSRHVAPEDEGLTGVGTAAVVEQESQSGLVTGILQDTTVQLLW